MTISTTRDKLRVTMVWAGTTNTRPLERAAEWARIFSPESTAPIACIWSPLPKPTELDLLGCDPVQFCWHELSLPKRIDRHFAVAHPRLPWSPWGTKSGPNFQFFQVLAEFAEAHPHYWMFAAEPDTYPIGRNPTGVVLDLLERNPSAWMIGGYPHPSITPTLDPTMHRHLNGAALYGVGDPRFREFLVTSWIPSLLWKIRQRPEYPYDCLTDAAENANLPEILAQSWSEVQRRFVPTAGIVNLSSRSLSIAEARRLCTQDRLIRRCTEEQTSPWMLHAKGTLGGSWRLELESTTR